MNKIFNDFARPDRFFTTLILLMLCCCHAPAFVALNDGLVADWSFDDCIAKENNK